MVGRPCGGAHGLDHSHHGNDSPASACALNYIDILAWYQTKAKHYGGAGSTDFSWGMDVDKTCPGGEKITCLNTIKKSFCVEKQLLILTYAAAGETQYMLSKTVKFISIFL